MRPKSFGTFEKRTPGVYSQYIYKRKVISHGIKVMIKCFTHTNIATLSGSSFSSICSSRILWDKSSSVVFPPSLSEREQQSSHEYGARDSVTPPQIVKTPNQPALRSENIVTRRNLLPKVGKVPPAQCLCRTSTNISWGTLLCQHTYRLLIGVHRYCWAFGWLSQQALLSNISKAHQISGITKNHRRQTLTCTILWKKMQLSLFSGTSQTQLRGFPLLTLVHEEKYVRYSFKKQQKPRQQVYI